ncbi:MAG TPA: GH116 family glycosyl hydrolase [bacterium]|nr:GH116 family glycosyl hydrolase [bacterium]HNS49341.1 GH116 family glycosyl hydrolase [bacterium]
MHKDGRPYPPKRLAGGGRRSFSGARAPQVAFPLGGIGAGGICLNASGALQDFSIHNQPTLSALPDGLAATDAGFALLHLPGRRPVTRLVEGLLPPERVYDQGLKGRGLRQGGYEGLPRFEACRFRGEFPVARLRLSDPGLPLAVELTGWSPFIPLDDRSSGLPCAILEYRLVNRSDRPVPFEFSYHLSHLAPGREPGSRHSRSRVLPGRGIFFYNLDPANSETFGSASLSVIGHRPLIKAEWFRGGWFDAVAVLWREVSEGAFRANQASDDPEATGRNGGSIMMAGRLGPGRSVTYPILITWHFPNGHLRIGAPGGAAAPPGAAAGDPPPAWRTYSAGQWPDAAAVAEHIHRDFVGLRRRTFAFRRALFASDLPGYVLDAVSANLAIMRSPTVLRLENGHLWCWEGCCHTGGCCSGSCTHVWNYAQAFAHLFPALERTLRAQEYGNSMDKRGHVTFRSALPEGPAGHAFHAAADGQLGGVMKVYRDWQISGDSGWLKRFYPLARRSLDYCIRTWDPDRKGSLFEPHHNTYDIEFWGPDGMCTSIYLGALTALAEMAEALGRPEEAAPYRELAARGGRFMDRELFNGEYYQQRVMARELRDRSFAEKVDGPGRGPLLEILRREGPRYQYGQGCLADGVIGAWMARLYGLELPLEPEHVRRSLRSIFRHNFKADLKEHACTQRPGYAIGHEAGLLLCTWPRGGRPTLPFPYSDEVWTGFEYQVAGHLIMEGMAAEGLTLVRAARDRYDGRTRNPWNEYECGNYYARAMSSYALLAALSGFHYSAVTGRLRLAPRLDGARFRCFFSTASGYGSVSLDGRGLRIDVLEGELRVRRVELDWKGKRVSREWPVRAAPGQPARLIF